MLIGLHVKYLLLFSDFNGNWIFSTDFRKIIKYQISLSSFQWEPSCPMRTDRQSKGQKDTTKLIASVRKFAKAPEKEMWEW